ncbi:MAG: thioredoxin family protein [Anaerolineae bacterium]|nr:thioredoxin family protein [Anaerolineae bacterium]NIN95060.1 thioredoxin family protein [Anaerolineae bacterium]NIQ78099.1 thioredoxin family protein [Anaerolineae bacterium]
MLSIKILGPGCANCHRVEQIAVDALAMLDAEATIQHVTDHDEIGKYSILYTPGLVINEQVVCAGRIPSIDEVASWAEEALGQDQEEEKPK